MAAKVAPYLLFLLLAPSALAFDPDFGFYPSGAQSCLNGAAKKSNCKGDTATDLNKCFCGNGGNFAIIAAQCLGKNDADEVETVFTTMSDACDHSNTPLKVSKDNFTDAADSAANDDDDDDDDKSATTTSATKTTPTASSATKTPASTSASTTTSSTASPTDSSAAGADGDKKKLSTGATVGIAAGVSVAGVAAIAGLAFFLVRRRKRSNAADESHPMLSHEKYGGGGGGAGGIATTYPPHDPSPSLGGGGFEQDTKSHYSASSFGVPPPQQQQHSYASVPNPSPDPQRQSFLSAWEPPSGSTAYASPNLAAGDARGSQYIGPYAPPQVVAELPSETQQEQRHSNVFELDSHGGAPQAPPQSYGQSSPPPQQPPAAQPSYRPYVPGS